LVGNARVADLVLRSHNPLRQCRRRREERARDFFCREAAHLAQREGYLRVLRERRVAASEDQAQAIVLDRLALCRLLRGERLGMLLLQRIEARAPADGIDRLEAAGRDEPGARVRRHAFGGPLLERRAERLVQRLLREVEVDQQAQERRKNTARFRAVNRQELGIRSTGLNYY